MTHLFFLFIVSVILPFADYSAADTGLLSWIDWWSSPKAIEKSSELSEGISKLSFIAGSLPLSLTYDRKAVDENIKTVSELGSNQLYIVMNSQPGDLFNVCFRTPPTFSSGYLPHPPVIVKPSTGQGIPDIQNGEVRQVTLAPDTDRWQHEFLARWRLPPGKQSLVLSIEDNEHGWVLEPECSGIVSEGIVSEGIDSPLPSNVDIYYRNKQATKIGSDYSDDNSRSGGSFFMSEATDTVDTSESFPSSGGGGFGGGDTLDDLFKKRPGNRMAPLYSFELMSELVSSMILVPVSDGLGGVVKKQTWDTRIVLKIKQGWNEQTIIISQELWNRITGANLERSSELFLALSSNPDNPEAAFDLYLDSHPAQPLPTEDYRRYAQQAFILSPKQLRSVAVFPGHCPTGIGCSGGTSQVDKEMASLSINPTDSQSQRGAGRHKQGSRGDGSSGGGDGSDEPPDNGLCQYCNKPAFAFNKCPECLNRKSDRSDLGEDWQWAGKSGARKGKKKKRSGFAGKSVAGYPPCAARHHKNLNLGSAEGQQAVAEIGLQFQFSRPSTEASLQPTEATRGNDSTGFQLAPARGIKVTLTPLAARPRYDTPLTDIGANLVKNERFPNLPEVLAEAVRSGVGTIIITGASIPLSRQARNIVMRRQKPSSVPDRVTDQATAAGASSAAPRCSLYYTVGCHPHHAKDFLKHGGILAMKEILERDRGRCVAVGECGLDYEHEYSPVEDQSDVFEQQLALAVEMQKPLFLHERKAHDDFKKMLGDYIEQLPAKKMACVHCFTGNSEALQNYIDMGCSIGITGWIAGDKNRDLVEALQTVGWDVLRDRLMIETDAPFLCPFQVMSPEDNPRMDFKKRMDNVPANLPYVVYALSEVLGVDPEEIAAATSRNAREIFLLSGNKGRQGYRKQRSFRQKRPAR